MAKAGQWKQTTKKMLKEVAKSDKVRHLPLRMTIGKYMPYTVAAAKSTD